MKGQKETVDDETAAEDAAEMVRLLTLLPFEQPWSVKISKYFSSHRLIHRLYTLRQVTQFLSPLP